MSLFFSFFKIENYCRFKFEKDLQLCYTKIVADKLLIEVFLSFILFNEGGYLGFSPVYYMCALTLAPQLHISCPLLYRLQFFEILVAGGHGSHVAYN